MPGMTLALARAICDGAIKHAQEQGWKISVAVLDAGGNPVLVNRMDECNFLSADIARGKAYGAAAWRIPSADLSQRFSQLAASAPGMVAASGQRLVPVQGALPVWDGGECIGAVGASGVLSSQDEDAVRTGILAAGLSPERKA